MRVKHILYFKVCHIFLVAVACGEVVGSVFAHVEATFEVTYSEIADMAVRL